MQIGKDYILVNIDKELQRTKKERLPSGIYISPDYAFMMYNLQYGEILQIGKNAQNIYPEAEPGDVALFHHGVEDNDSNLLYEEKQMFVKTHGVTEFRVMNEHRCISSEGSQLYGVIKPNGELIPAAEYVFVDPVVTILKRRYPSDLIGIVDDEVWDDHELIKYKIDELKGNIEMMKESYSTVKSIRSGKDVDRLDEISHQIEFYMKQQAQLTHELHKEKLALATVTFINPRTSEDLAGTLPGDKIIVSQNILYALQVEGQRFLLLNTHGIYANTTIGNSVISK